MKHEHKIHTNGFAIEVDPPEMVRDVMHYLVTGGLLCGRSLDGVTWKRVDLPTVEIEPLESN